jgi:hypothetical protein
MSAGGAVEEGWMQGGWAPGQVKGADRMEAQ